MFANLKNKLIEEVKASPSKFQQFANAAQAAVSSSANTPSCSESTANLNTTNENVFSITEEDTPQNSPNKPVKLPAGAVRGRNSAAQTLNNGAIPRTRKLSNSSIASDVSFRLPTWDAGSVYHLQSDLDESGSEMGDTPSTAAKLDVITKEQLFDAYRKSLDRYHKYRCRYTDLAKKYKDLERDSTKARSVLVETQEKAIRRINELREQCSLEQQAKAHLEEALRIEMDDMQCKMQSYQTKLKLLGENPDNIASALAGVNSEQLIDLSTEILKPNENSLVDVNPVINNDESIEKKLENFENILKDRDQQIIELNNKLDLLRKQEEENVLLLAQTKAAIHSELENKEIEVNNLNETVKQLQNELQQAHKTDKNCGVTVEELDQMKDKLKQTQAAKQQLDAKIISTEHILQEMLEKHDEKVKTYKAMEEQMQKQTNELEAKLQEMKQQNQQLSEMVTRYQQNEVSLAEVDNELNRTKNENDILKEKLAENEVKLQETESQFNDRLQVLQQLQEELKGKEEGIKKALEKTDELQQQLQREKLHAEENQQKHVHLENELKIIKEQTTSTESETITNLKAELERVSVELNQQLKSAKEQLGNKEKELKLLAKKATKSEKQLESYLKQIQQQNEDIEKLKNELIQQDRRNNSLQEASQQREQQMNEEKNELKAQINGILNEISQMEEQMRIVQESHQELDLEKRNLENKIEHMQQQTQTKEEDSKHWQEKLSETEEKLKACELKLQTVEIEHTQMAEKSCLLEENTNRLEKLLVDKERQQNESTEALISELKLKLLTTENSLQKLNEKMQEVLDENSRLHNSQELNDHDQRTLQDRYDSLEKEKACLEDSKQCLQQELNALKSKLIEEQKINEKTQNDILHQQEKIANLQKDLESKEELLREEKMLREKYEQDNHKLQEQLTVTQNSLTEANELLNEKQQSLKIMRSELEDIKLQHQLQLQENERKIEEHAERYKNLLLSNEKAMLILKEQLTRENEEKNQELEKLKEEFILLTEQKESLHQELLQNTAKLNVLLQNKEEFELLSKELHETRNQNSDLLEKIFSLEEDKQRHEIELQPQKDEQLQMMQELETLRQSKEKLLLELEHFKEEQDKEQQDKCKLLEMLENSKLQLGELLQKHNYKLEEIVKLQEQISKYTSDGNANEQLVIENEYLNKHVKQLETTLVKYQNEDKNKNLNSQDLKEKLKSLQCELYVCKENAEKHEIEIEVREKQIQELKLQNKMLSSDIEKQNTELQRQLEHIKYITEQDDAVQKDLLLTQNKLKDLEEKYNIARNELEIVKEQSAEQSQRELRQIDNMKKDLDRNTLTIEKLQAEVKDLNAELKMKQTPMKELQALIVSSEESDKEIATQSQLIESLSTSKSPSSSQDSEHLRKINETLQHELEELKHKSTQEISTLQQEIDDLQSTNKQMTDRIMDLEVLKAGLQAQKLFGLADNRNSQSNNNPNNENSNSSNDIEKTELENKLKTIMAEVQDVSNRNLFLEQKCENYLILEQSNERLKLQNAKLSRQLDETLVSMQHNEGVSANTEFEYLKNIMFQYLTGSANGNNETLVKVISAVLKFSPQQTQVALEKEHQRRSLINKIL